MVVAGTLPAVGVGLLEEHLDPSTANDLIHDVLSAAADQTVLLITHRTEGLELVDRVLDARTRHGRCFGRSKRRRREVTDARSIGVRGLFRP